MLLDCTLFGWDWEFFDFLDSVVNLHDRFEDLVDVNESIGFSLGVYELNGFVACLLVKGAVADAVVVALFPCSRGR